METVQIQKHKGAGCKNDKNLKHNDKNYEK